MFDKNYEFPMSRDYVSHWGLTEAVRELIQNAIDSNSPFEWSFENDKLFIISRYSSLDPRSLLLGRTSKANSTESIGSFGEGYKIALLVLTRIGCPVVIHNNAVDWVPKFIDSRRFDDEIFCVNEKQAVAKNEGVKIVVSNLAQSEIEEIKDCCLQMQQTIGRVKETSKGLILLDQPGRLYVGGLFICETGLQYGYNIKPEFIKLERDRQTISNFDFKILTKDMWFELEDYEFIALLIENDCPDLEYADMTTPEIIKEECYKLFVKQNPGKLVAESQKELRQMVADGLIETVYVGGGYGSVIKSSSSYQESLSTQQTKARTPKQVLHDWYVENKKHMNRYGKINFKELLSKSEDWGLK